MDLELLLTHVETLMDFVEGDADATDAAVLPPLREVVTALEELMRRPRDSKATGPPDLSGILSLLDKTVIPSGHNSMALRDMFKPQDSEASIPKLYDTTEECLAATDDVLGPWCVARVQIDAATGQLGTVEALNSRDRTVKSSSLSPKKHSTLKPPPQRLRDSRGRWLPSPATVPRVKRHPVGKRRRRRTQVELQMEQAIRFGYFDVPNLIVVTGRPLIGDCMKRFTQSKEQPDEVQVLARRISLEIWMRRLARARAA